MQSIIRWCKPNKKWSSNCCIGHFEKLWVCDTWSYVRIWRDARLRRFHECFGGRKTFTKKLNSGWKTPLSLFCLSKIVFNINDREYYPKSFVSPPKLSIVWSVSDLESWIFAATSDPIEIKNWYVFICWKNTFSPPQKNGD